MSRAKCRRVRVARDLREALSTSYSAGKTYAAVFGAGLGVWRFWDCGRFCGGRCKDSGAGYEKEERR